MVNPTFSNIVSVANEQQYEVNLLLYLHRMYEGPNRNQSELINPKHANSFGCTSVNNWTLYDGVGPDAKIIARAQAGLLTQTGTSSQQFCYNSFGIVFEDDRFKGSTLQVMGPADVENGEWDIVRGTGMFHLAQGVISKKHLKRDNHGDLIELDIHVFYPPYHLNCWRVGTDSDAWNKSILPPRFPICLLLSFVLFSFVLLFLFRSQYRSYSMKWIGKQNCD